jgi:hypothetical protein
VHADAVDYPGHELPELPKHGGAVVIHSSVPIQHNGGLGRGRGVGLACGGRGEGEWEKYISGSRVVVGVEVQLSVQASAGDVKTDKS